MLFSLFNQPIDVTVPVRTADSCGKQLKKSTMSFGISSSNDGEESENDEENRLLLESLEVVESQMEQVDDDASSTRSRLTSGIFSLVESQTSSTIRGGTRSRCGRGSRGARGITARGGRRVTAATASRDDVEIIQIDTAESNDATGLKRSRRR